MEASDFINFELLGNPINWLIIVVTLIFVSYAAYVIWESAEFPKL